MSDEPLPNSEIILYQTEDGSTRIQCRFENETLWLTQVQVAELFQTSIPNINLHLKAIYAEGEMIEGATIKSYLIVRIEGADGQAAPPGGPRFRAGCATPQEITKPPACAWHADWAQVQERREMNRPFHLFEYRDEASSNPWKLPAQPRFAR